MGSDRALEFEISTQTACSVQNILSQLPFQHTLASLSPFQLNHHFLILSLGPLSPVSSAGLAFNRPHNVDTDLENKLKRAFLVLDFLDSR